MHYNTYFNMDDLKVKPKFWICKPNKQTVGVLKDFYGAQYTVDAGAINKLTFTIPSAIWRKNQYVVNDKIDLIRERYLIKMEFQRKIEYFIVLKINKNMEQNGNEDVSYECYSLGYRLAQKLVRDMDETSENFSNLANNILSGTNWKLDYVDVDFDLMFRSMQVTSSTALQAFFDLCTKFNAIPVFDTVNETISVFESQNYGKNKGITFRKGIYLESFNLSIDPEAMITRLHAYGEDGLTFRALSPTGSDYIEDYSFYMYPFECDDKYKVIKSSKWMSDGLCIALLKYWKLLDFQEGVFDKLLKEQTDKQAEIVTEEQTLSILNTSMKVLLNERDVINDTYGENAPSRDDWKNAIAKIDAKQREIDTSEKRITAFKNSLTDINKKIENYRISVSVEKNFTKDELIEWAIYQNSKEYFNESIIDAQELLEDAKKVFEEYKQPPLNLDISIENFLMGTEPNFDRTRLGVGDTVKLKSQDLGVFVKARVMQLVFNFDNYNININVSNVTKEKDNMDRFIESMNRSSSTSTTVDNDKFAWGEGREAKNELTQYLNNTLDSAKQLIEGGMNGSVTMNERGLMARDLKDPNSFLMIQNGKMFITPDNGNSVSVAIDKNGVHAERLVGRLILGNKLQIEDDLGVVTIAQGNVSVYDLAKKLRVKLGRYEDPSNSARFKYGLRIYDGAFDIRTSANSNRGIQIDEDGFRAFNNNGVRVFDVNSTTGAMSVVGSFSIKSTASTNRGVEIDGNGIRGYKSSGSVAFEIDNSGNATFAGRLNSANGTLDQVGGSVSNITGSVRDLTGSINAMRGSFDGVVTGTLSASTINTIYLRADQVEARMVTADQIQVNNLSAISANMGTINAGTLNGVNINTTQDIRVGRNMNMQGSGSNLINFSDSTSIGSDGRGGMSVNVFNTLNIQAGTTMFYGNVNFSNATVTGLK